MICMPWTLDTPSRPGDRITRSSGRPASAVRVVHAVRGGLGDLGAVGVRRVDAEDAELDGEERELLEREGEARVLRVALDVGVELGGEERAAELVALQLRHVHAVGSETAERLVERGRHVANAEHERRDGRAGAADRHAWLARQRQEPGRVVVLVLDVAREDVEPVEPGSGPRRERGDTWIAELGDLPGGAGRVVADDGRPAALADDLA